jgi:hypothetical protein
VVEVAASWHEFESNVDVWTPRSTVAGVEVWQKVEAVTRVAVMASVEASWYCWLGFVDVWALASIAAVGEVCV